MQVRKKDLNYQNSTFLEFSQIIVLCLIELYSALKFNVKKAWLFVTYILQKVGSMSLSNLSSVNLLNI